MVGYVAIFKVIVSSKWPKDQHEILKQLAVKENGRIFHKYESKTLKQKVIYDLSLEDQNLSLNLQLGQIVQPCFSKTSHQWFW